jgi:hypothetical protein
MRINRRIAAGTLVMSAALGLGAITSPASAHSEDDARGVTTVVLNQPLVGALVGLGVAPVRQGSLTAPGGTYQVAFPITSITQGRIGHSGGLAFTKAAAGDVRITNFIVDTKSGFLTAKTTVNGKNIGRIAVFSLGAVQEVSPGVTPSCAGVAAGLSLTPAAAGALLGDPTATAFIGDACVVPAAGDDD